MSIPGQSSRGFACISSRLPQSRKWIFPAGFISRCWVGSGIVNPAPAPTNAPRAMRIRFPLLINRGFLWRTDVCLLINGPGNWDTRSERGRVSWWGEQHHQRGRAYATTRSRSPWYTERCFIRSTTQNGGCSDLPLGLMRLPYRTFLHQYKNFPRNSQS